MKQFLRASVHLSILMYWYQVHFVLSPHNKLGPRLHYNFISYSEIWQLQRSLDIWKSLFERGRQPLVCVTVMF